MNTVDLRRFNLRKVIDGVGGSSKMTDVAFCEAYNLNPSHISQLIKGHGSFGERAARNLEKKIGLPEFYLDKQHEQSSAEVEQPSVERIRKTKMLPVLSWVQAGSLTSTEPVQKMDIKEWYPALSEDDCEKCFYLRVTGISNYPEYQEGDYILVDPSVYIGDVVSGDLIVVQSSEGETFKKLIIESNQRKYLQALNPNWEPNVIEFDGETRLIGLVIDGFRPIGGSKRKRVRKT